jgi:hypothetical protein
MKVRFAEDILNDPPTWSHLDDIIHHFESGRHVWEIDDIDLLKDSDWLQKDWHGRAGRRNLETLEKCYAASSYRTHHSRMHSLTIVITRQRQAHTELTPEQAKHCLDKPAYVAVENAESDRTFLEAMMQAFGRQDLLTAAQEGWLEYLHLGGFGEIEKRIEQIRAKIKAGPLRVFVLADSDRHFPLEITQTIQKVTDYCDKVGDIPYVILQKRAIENYLPLEALEHALGTFNKRYQAFTHLTEEQRSYYDMKKGLGKDKNTGQALVTNAQQSLFQNVPLSILNELCDGFGKKAWEYFKSPQFITKATVQAICTGDPDEIKNILEVIDSLL